MKDPDRFRRAVAGLALIAWPVLHFAGFITGVEATDHDPAIFAAHPDRVRLSGLILHWSAMAIVPVVLSLGHLLRPKMPALANAAVTLGLIGAVSGASLLLADFYDLALAQLVSHEQAVAVTERAYEYPEVLYGFLLPGFAVHIGLLMLTIGLAARRLAGWWVPVLLVAGLVLPFLTATQPVAVQALGAVLLLAALGPIGVRILRMSPQQWRPAGSAEQQSATTASA